MRYLGIDYGRKRIGIAVSDPDGKIAFPRGVIFNEGMKQAARHIAQWVKEEGVGGIIIGLPLGSEGQETEESKVIREFAAVLHQEVSTPLEFENEMFTTRMVQQEGVAKEHSDAAAAAVILQTYLDRSKI